MTKIKWVTVKDTELLSASNEVSVEETGLKKDFEVKVIDQNNNKIWQYKDVKGGMHKVIITMKFDWETDFFSETSSDNVIYYLKDSNNWKIDENQGIRVKPGKSGEFQKAIKSAHKKLLKKKFHEKFGELKKGIEATDLLYIIGDDNTEGENINVIISSKNEDPTNTIHFNWDKVELVIQLGLKKQIDFDTAVNVIYEEFEKEKSKLTTGWIIFFVILAIAVILIIAFWKEIWRWIKGERKQEKKVREQIDIF
jgi:hypothetical protein